MSSPPVLHHFPQLTETFNNLSPSGADAVISILGMVAKNAQLKQIMQLRLAEIESDVKLKVLEIEEAYKEQADKRNKDAEIWHASASRYDIIIQTACSLGTPEGISLAIKAAGELNAAAPRFTEMAYRFAKDRNDGLEI